MLLSNFCFQSHFSHLNFRYRACFQQRAPCHSACIECEFSLKRVRNMIKTQNKSFLILSNFAYCFYFLPNILSVIVSFAKSKFLSNQIVFKDLFSRVRSCILEKNHLIFTIQYFIMHFESLFTIVSSYQVNSSRNFILITPKVWWCTPPGISSSAHSIKLKPTPEVHFHRRY